MTKNIGYVVLVNESGEPFIAHATTPSGFIVSRRPSYIAKVKNGPYTRYFYTDNEYQAYLKNKSGSKLKMRDQYTDHMRKASGLSDKLEADRARKVGRSVEKMSDRDLEEESQRLSDEWKELDNNNPKHWERLNHNVRRRNEIYVEQATRNFKRTGVPDMTTGKHASEGWLDDDLYEKLLESGFMDAWYKKYR